MRLALYSALVRTLACLLLWAPSAHARSILELDVATQPAQLKDWGDYVVVEAPAALKSVVDRADDLRPSLEAGGYELHPDQALWIAFTVPATPDDQRWYVRVPQPGLDSVTLYTRGVNDTWTPASAGDALPVSSWALPHPYPVLPLAISAAEPTRYMLRVQASDGLSAPIEFVSESWLTWEQQRMSLLYGGYFGLLAMGAIFALASSWALRDSAYAWLGIWAALGGLTASCAVGIAGLHVWPEFPAWSDSAYHVLPAATSAPFVFFFNQTLVLRERARGLFWCCIALGVAGLLCAAAALLLPSPWRATIAHAQVAASTVLTTAVALWAWLRGDRFARNLLLAMSPLAIALPTYHVASLYGYASTDAVMAVLLGGLAITTCAAYLLLAWRDQTKRDHRRRIAQLHEVDPATGLVNDVMFARRAGDLVRRAQRFNHQSVVALVEFPNFANLRDEFGRKHSVELLLRLAERLTAMLRSMDTVARLGESRFGILVEGPVAPSRARGLCAKVIAYCITPLAGLPLGLVVKPRIALALVPLHGDDVEAVIARLEELLNQSANDPSRVILLADQAQESSGSATPQAQVAPASHSRGDSAFQLTSTRESAFQATTAAEEVE